MSWSFWPGASTSSPRSRGEDARRADAGAFAAAIAIGPSLCPLRDWRDAVPLPASGALNDRERQVLRLAGEGLSANEIAAQLNLSHGTVRNYLSEAIGKLNVGNRIEAYRLARQKGWL